jgi:activator of HSP90 ATPase
MSEVIRQVVMFEAAPDRVLQALLDGPTFTRMTGAPAEVDGVAGGAFSCFGGVISGRNLEVVEGRRLVQGWRAAPWPEGSYSVVRFEVAPHDGGTRLTLEHSAFPAGQSEHLSAGWETNYWAPLRKLFAAADA